MAHGKPVTLDVDEPRRVAEAVEQMRLQYAVITSVDRDDLPDGGAGIFAETIRDIKRRLPDCRVEVLIPDFKGEREPLEMKGGTTFHFVTDGVESAVARAREVAGDRDVSIHGGADTVQQALRAGLLDELEVHVTPRILGGGARLLESIGDATFELVRAVDAPGVTHVKYRVVR